MPVLCFSLIVLPLWATNTADNSTRVGVGSGFATAGVVVIEGVAAEDITRERRESRHHTKLDMLKWFTRTLKVCS